MKVFPTVLVVLLLSLAPRAVAQDSTKSQSPFPTGIGIGYQLTLIQNDFGLGLNVTSPTFMNDVFAVRVRVAMSGLDHVDEDSVETRTNYPTLSVSVAGFSNEVADNIRCYGEGGGMLLFPSDKFSSKSTVFGIFGVFGFEFFITESICYVIELGATVNRAIADKVPGAPIYANGFMVGTGLRAMF